MIDWASSIMEEIIAMHAHASFYVHTFCLIRSQVEMV